MGKKWIIIWIILFVLLGIPYHYFTGDATIFIALGIFFLLHAICKLIVYTAEKLNLTNAQWWYKKGQTIRRTKQKKSFTELQKSDSQAKVVGIIGKPDTIENRETGKEIWTYNFESEENRIITFQDGFIEKIEVKYQ